MSIRARNMKGPILSESCIYCCGTLRSILGMTVSARALSVAPRCRRAHWSPSCMTATPKPVRRMKMRQPSDTAFRHEGAAGCSWRKVFDFRFGGTLAPSASIRHCDCFVELLLRRTARHCRHRHIALSFNSEPRSNSTSGKSSRSRSPSQVLGRHFCIRHASDGIRFRTIHDRSAT